MLASKTNGILDQLVKASDWRFAIGVRIRYSNPTLLYQTYPEDWLRLYDKEAMLLQDPTIMWGMTNIGVIDWTDLKTDDAAGVFDKAAKFGLKYGIAVSVGEPSQRTLGFFARASAPFSDEDKDKASELVKELHDATEGVLDIPDDELNKLRALNNDLASHRTQ